MGACLSRVSKGGSAPKRKASTSASSNVLYDAAEMSPKASLSAHPNTCPSADRKPHMAKHDDTMRSANSTSADCTDPRPAPAAAPAGSWTASCPRSSSAPASPPARSMRVEDDANRGAGPTTSGHGSSRRNLETQFNRAAASGADEEAAESEASASGRLAAALLEAEQRAARAEEDARQKALALDSALARMADEAHVAAGQLAGAVLEAARAAEAEAHAKEEAAAAIVATVERAAAAVAAVAGRAATAEAEAAQRVAAAERRAAQAEAGAREQIGVMQGEAERQVARAKAEARTQVEAEAQRRAAAEEQLDAVRADVGALTARVAATQDEVAEVVKDMTAALRLCVLGRADRTALPFGPRAQRCLGTIFDTCVHGVVLAPGWAVTTVTGKERHKAKTRGMDVNRLTWHRYHTLAERDGIRVFTQGRGALAASTCAVCTKAFKAEEAFLLARRL